MKKWTESAMGKWAKAIRAYRAAAQEDQPVNFLEIEDQPKKVDKINGERIKEEARELRVLFHGIEGQMALALLKASNRYIRTGVEGDDSGMTAYLLSEYGFRSLHEVAGSRVYSIRRPEANLVPTLLLKTITSVTAVEKAMELKGIEPEEFLDYLYGELNLIASQAPPLPKKS